MASLTENAFESSCEIALGDMLEQLLEQLAQILEGGR